MIVTIASGALVAASVSILFLVAGCHPATASNGFSGNAADKATEKRLTKIETMPHLQAYDELFYVPPPEDADTN